jgi:hypothetical protein
MDAAVTLEHARGCSFTNGRIAHVGGMGLCLLKGTAYDVVDGNEICDLGGGGIGAGGLRNRQTLKWSPPPVEGDYRGYRITNNHIHDCGTDYFGAIGIFLALSQDAVIAHNLVHDTAYTGIDLTGDEDPKSSFARNNTLEYNHVHHVMKVAGDGAAIYLTFPQAGSGALIRGNLMHDTGRGFAVYFDEVCRRQGCAGYRLEDNVVYQTSTPLADRPHGPSFDNLITPGDGDVGGELVEAMQAKAGLEPAYRRLLLGVDEPPYEFHRLTNYSIANDVWSAWQLHWSRSGKGMVQVFRRTESKQDSQRLKLQSLDPAAVYEVQNLDTKMTSRHGGRELIEQGLLVTLPKPGPTTIAYNRVASP